MSKATFISLANFQRFCTGLVEKLNTRLGGLWFGTDDDGKWGYKTSSDGTVTPFRNPTGDAAASNVLSGKIFSNADEDDLTGTMTDNGTVTETLDCGESYTITEGYHSGSGTVTANSLSSQTSGTATAAYILSGYTAWVGGSILTGTMTNYSGYNMTGCSVVTTYYSSTSGMLGLQATEDGYYSTSTTLFATNEDIADVIGLTEDIIAEGNTVLGIEGTASTSLVDALSDATWTTLSTSVAYGVATAAYITSATSGDLYCARHAINMDDSSYTGAISVSSGGTVIKSIGATSPNGEGRVVVAFIEATSTSITISSNGTGSTAGHSWAFYHIT